MIIKHGDTLMVTDVVADEIEMTENQIRTVKTLKLENCSFKDITVPSGFTRVKLIKSKVERLRVPKGCKVDTVDSTVMIKPIVGGNE